MNIKPSCSGGCPIKREVGVESRAVNCLIVIRIALDLLIFDSDAFISDSIKYPYLLKLIFIL